MQNFISIILCQMKFNKTIEIKMQDFSAWNIKWMSH